MLSVQAVELCGGALLRKRYIIYYASILESAFSKAVPLLLCLYRLVLGIFCLGSLTNGVLWITFSPIADESRSYFDVEDYLVNLLSLMFLFLYPVSRFICSSRAPIYGGHVQMLLNLSLKKVNVMKGSK